MQHKRLEGALASRFAMVACLNEDKDYILGYALMDGDKPFAYVKLAFRSPGLQIAPKLIKEIK